MKIYGIEIKEQTTKELEHRAQFLKRNRKFVDSIGNVEMSFRHRQEEICIAEELLRRGA